MKINMFSKSILVSLLMFMSSMASAHIGYIAWNANNDGSVDFYGLTYHGLSASSDNFAANPAGFTINGTNVTFDVGSAVGLENCASLYNYNSTCSTIWNNLGLDGGLAANGGFYNYPSANVPYGKYASTHLNSSQLSALGIQSGSNFITFTTWANNVDYAGQTFSSANVPINLIVAAVPEPVTLALFSFGIAGLAFARRKRNV